MTRVAHVTDGYLPRLGGIETQVHDLALMQVAEGHDVEIITATPADGTDRLAVHRPAVGRSRAADGAITAGAARALAGGYDVLHVHLSIASPLALSVLWQASHAGRPVVATMHSLWGLAGPALAGARRVLGRRAAAVTWTAVSSAAAAPLRRSLDVPVAIVPNCVDVRWWAAVAPGPPSTTLRALSVMRMSRRKRPLPLVRMITATGRLVTSPLSLTVVGAGRQLARLRREASRSGGVEVALTGRLSRTDIRSRMYDHDLYLAPAPLESFGLAALEARSAGLPVVAFRDSGVADFVRDGWDGVLVDDDRGFVEAVADLAANRESLHRLQANARLHRPELGWPVTLAGYDRAYEQARVRPSELRHAGVWR